MPSSLDDLLNNLIHMQTRMTCGWLAIQPTIYWAFASKVWDNPKLAHHTSSANQIVGSASGLETWKGLEMMPGKACTDVERPNEACVGMQKPGGGLGKLGETFWRPKETWKGLGSGRLERLDAMPGEG